MIHHQAMSNAVLNEGDFNRGYGWDNSYSSNYKKAGKELRRELVHLHKPLYTDEITLSNFVFSATPNAEEYANDGVLYSKIFGDLGHDLKIQLELYGCSNYNIEQSKFTSF